MDHFDSIQKKVEHMAELFHGLPVDHKLMTMQGILYDVKDEKQLFEALEAIIKDIRKGNMTEKEKYENRFGRATKWATSRLRNEKDPEKLRKLTARRLAAEYSARTGWAQNLLYKLMKKVKQKECMRRLRERRKAEVV
ncbi:MAG: hypothetical protein ABR911_08390 [Syntrophales bacterium]|jgi:RNA binding exosome subunit